MFAKLKSFITIFLVIIMLSVLNGCGEKQINLNDIITQSCDMTFESLKDELENLGFSDIETVELEDLVASTDPKNGKVKSLKINDLTNFENNTTFPISSKIIIEYHSVKKIFTPFSSADIENIDYLEAASLLEKNGFTNIETEEVFDIEPGTIDFYNEISINNVQNFEENTSFPIDAKAVITVHKPYTIYNCLVKVNFIGNWFFDKYDVTVEMDGISVKLEHGEDKDIVFNVKEGGYRLVFRNSEDSSIKTIINLDINCDIELSYDLSVSSKEINVKELYVDRKEELPSNKVKIPNDKYAYIGKNYQEVEKTFKNIGFKKVTVTPIYDIVWGFTSELSVSDVTIKGSNEFKPRDIYDVEDEIVITYHMKEEDNPANYITISTSANEYVGKNKDDVKQLFKDMGFKYVSTMSNEMSSSEIDINMNNTVYDITIADKTFNKGDTVNINDSITINYYKVVDKIKMPKDSTEYERRDLEEVIAELKDLGFTNIATHSHTHDNYKSITYHREGEVWNITDFKKGDLIKSDSTISIDYYHLVEREILNLDNSAELKALLDLDRYKDTSKINAFVRDNKGKFIEINMVVSFVEQYPKTTTRYNFLLLPVVNDNLLMEGPAFMLENKSYYDLKLAGSYIPDSFGLGMYCTVLAEIIDYDSDFIYLDPLEIRCIEQY